MSVTDKVYLVCAFNYGVLTYLRMISNRNVLTVLHSINGRNNFLTNRQLVNHLASKPTLFRIIAIVKLLFKEIRYRLTY